MRQRYAYAYDMYDEAEEDLLSAYRILLIEDNKHDVWLIKKKLHLADSVCRQLVVEDVPRLTDAVALLDKGTFDLVILDLHLLDVAGVAGVAAIHASAPNIPMIVYSGSNSQRLKEEALICGATHFLMKGYESLFELEFAVQKALSHPQSTMEDREDL